MWREIRGQGLSYGYYLRPSLDEGLMYFGLREASNVVKAYEVTQAMVVRPPSVCVLSLCVCLSYKLYTCVCV